MTFVSGALDRVAHLVPQTDVSDDPSRRRWPRWQVVASAGAFALALVVLALLRQPGHRLWDTVWAEDGTVFMHDANAMNPATTLLRGYAGYANLLPRLVAAPSAVLPPVQLARYAALASVVTDVVFALVVVHLSRTLVRSVWLRIALAAATVLFPTLYFEAGASIANVNWAVFIAGFWAVMATSVRRSDVVLRVLVVVVGILSTPLTALYLPLAILVALGRRRRPEWLVVVALVLAGIVQYGAGRVTTDSSPHLAGSLTDTFAILPTRVLGALLMGDRPLRWLWENHARVTPWLLLIAFLAVVAVLALRSDHEARCFAVLGIGQAVIVFVVPVMLRGSHSMLLTRGILNENGSRYVVAPAVLLLGVLVVLADHQPAEFVKTIVVIWIGVVIVWSYSLAGPRSKGPSWADNVRAARASCVAAGDTREPIAIAPGGGWFFTLDCSRLTS